MPDADSNVGNTSVNTTRKNHCSVELTFSTCNDFRSLSVFHLNPSECQLYCGRSELCNMCICSASSRDLTILGSSLGHMRGALIPSLPPALRQTLELLLQGSLCTWSIPHSPHMVHTSHCVVQFACPPASLSSPPRAPTGLQLALIHSVSLVPGLLSGTR